MKWVKRIAIAVAVLLFVPLIVLLVLGHRAGANNIQVSAEINAPPQQVWQWIDDGNRLKQWVTWLVEVQDTQKPAVVGATRVLVMKDENNGGALMRINSKVTEYVPPSRMRLRVSDDGGEFDGDQSYNLIDLGNGRTRLESRLHFHYTQWFANLMEPVISPQAEKKMKGDLARLKSLVEAQAAVR